LENAVPDDISVIAAIAFVEKTWIDANQIQRWSVQFNRFDQGLSTWVPFPSKRIREDEERVFFAVVLPGFSDLAITGSTTLPEQPFSVAGLTVEPQQPRAGDRISIGAHVTNDGAQRAVYPADLWVDNSIVATQAMTLEAGERADFSFTITRPEGEYSVRVERELAGFTVVPADQTAAPGVGGISITSKGLALVAAAAAALALGGVYLALGRPRRSC
jgi:hypothetical protein